MSTEPLTPPAETVTVPVLVRSPVTPVPTVKVPEFVTSATTPPAAFMLPLLVTPLAAVTLVPAPVVIPPALFRLFALRSPETLVLLPDCVVRSPVIAPWTIIAPALSTSPVTVPSRVMFAVA